MRRLNLVLRGANGPEEIRVEGKGERWTLRRADRALEVTVADLPGRRISVLLPDGRQVSGRARERAAGVVEVSTPAGEQDVLLADPLHDRLAHAQMAAGSDAEEEIRALMPGRIVEVSVKEGDRVQAGALLLVLEAMKMQNEIRASRGGTVVRCEAEAGEPVEKGALLLLISAAVETDS